MVCENGKWSAGNIQLRSLFRVSAALGNWSITVTTALISRIMKHLYSHQMLRSTPQERFECLLVIKV